MINCQSCLYDTSHPFGLSFDSEGICSGCNIHNEKLTIDWNFRLARLKNIVKEYKSNCNNYDCIVPITGDRDSFYTLHIVVNVLKLNPLCVVYNTTHFSRWGHKNITLMKHAFNVDFQMYLPSQHMVRDFMKSSLYHLGNMYWHVHAGHHTYPVHMAQKWKIPLIIWGCHEAVDQVGMFSHLDEVEMSRRYRDDFHLMGCSPDMLVSKDPFLDRHNWDVYRYPEYNSIYSHGIRGIYLSNFIPWNQREQHSLMTKLYRYSTTKSRVLMNGNENSGCVFYSGIHDYFRRLSLGYSRNRVHLVREVRWKRITLAEARYHEFNDLINFSFDKKIIKLFAEFLDIKVNALNILLKSYANSSYWVFTDHNIRYVGPSLSKQSPSFDSTVISAPNFSETSSHCVEYTKPIVLSPGVPY